MNKEEELQYRVFVKTANFSNLSGMVEPTIGLAAAIPVIAGDVLMKRYSYGITKRMLKNTDAKLKTTEINQNATNSGSKNHVKFPKGTTGKRLR